MALAGEFDIIAKVFAPLAKEPGALGLKDDAAVLTVIHDHQLIVTCDTIVGGVHFLESDPPHTVGHKALAVNLSDLIAKGAHGYAYTLSVAVPKDTEMAWLEGFAEGLAKLQEIAGISLIGGDTTATSGPPTITITALGLVQQEYAITRFGAKPGDRLYVNGTIGDAFLGLQLLQDPSRAARWSLSQEDVEALVHQYRSPKVRPGAALMIGNFAKASIDVSDGLVADTGKLCSASHVGAEIEIAQVPFSAAARKVLQAAPDLMPELIAGGDDYVALAAVPERAANVFESESNDHDIAFSHIGRIIESEGAVRVMDADGADVPIKISGFSHF